MKKVSNHYVPQFLLKNFSNNRKSIGTYMWKQKKYIKEASIKKQACKDYLYGKDMYIEDNFMRLEKIWAKIISAIIEQEKIPLKLESYTYLITFILTCEARNLKSANLANKYTDLLAKKFLEKLPNSELTYETINDINVEMEIPNLIPLQAAFLGSPLLVDLKCCLLINKIDRSFITSDSPTVRYNQMYLHRNYDRGYGLYNRGLQIFFPISSKVCICFYDSDIYDASLNKCGNIEIIRSKQVDELNKVIYLNSYNNIFFNDKVKKSYIEKLTKDIYSHKKLEHSEILEFDMDKDSVIILAPNQVQYKMKLPIFKIKKEYLDIELPPHMKGPVRPYILLSDLMD
ncbi:MAG: DUF4238 domain-containing protein [Paeniclostridium sordellii]|nr:DUF4238 domain-containing protein [Paeniclostridium sordellii]